MKKLILTITGVAVLAAGAYFGTRLLAQTPTSGTTQTSTPQAPAGTRVVGVVNIGYVFNKYVRANQCRAELEDIVKPFKEKGKKLSDEIKYWQEEMQKPSFNPKEREKYDAGIRNNKRQLEDMQIEIGKHIGKKQEDNLVTLWKDVNTGIDAVAKAYGFQVVLAYGDPMEKEPLLQYPNVNRKMQAMDLGSTIPMYVHESVDLSRVITDTLNSWHEQRMKNSGSITPTGGTGTK